VLQETALGDLDTDVCRLISFITSSLTGWAFHSPGEAGLGLAGTLMHLNGPGRSFVGYWQGRVFSARAEL